jgi:hypothetical protein
MAEARERAFLSRAGEQASTLSEPSHAQLATRSNSLSWRKEMLAEKCHHLVETRKASPTLVRTEGKETASCTSPVVAEDIVGVSQPVGEPRSVSQENEGSVRKDELLSTIAALGRIEHRYH